MAFLPPEQQNQYAPQGQTSSTGQPPAQTGGSSGTGAGSSKAGGEPSSGGTPSSGAPTQFGSSASKLSDYLSANAPQIQNQANTVAGNLNNQYNQVSGDIGNAANQFGQSVAGGYTAPNQSLVNQATSNPTGFVSNPGNVSAFQGQLNDTYNGPTSYESTTPYGQIQGEVNQAVQNANLVNSPAGLQSYFAQTAGPNATQASNTLDALLLQGNPQAQQTIQGAAKQFGGLTNQFGNTVTAADQGVTAAQQAAQQAQQYAQGQLGNAVTGFNTSLGNDLTKAQNQVNQYNQAIPGYQNQTQALNNIVNNWNALNYVSPDPNFGFSTVDMANPVSGLPSYQLANAPTQNQIATPEQLAQEQALNQLAGQNLVSTIDPNVAVGGYNAPTGNFNVAPTANQIWQNILGSAAATQKQNIDPAAAWLWQHQNLQNTLNTDEANYMKQLQAFDPTLGQVQAKPS